MRVVKIQVKMAEDAAMETCPSPEIGDSRKRPLDSDPENEQTKRSHFSSGKSLINCLYHLQITKNKENQVKVKNKKTERKN